MADNRLVGGCGLQYCHKSDSQQQRLHNTRGVRRTKSKFLIMSKPTELYIKAYKEALRAWLNYKNYNGDKRKRIYLLLQERADSAREFLWNTHESLPCLTKLADWYYDEDMTKYEDYIMRIFGKLEGTTEHDNAYYRARIAAIRRRTSTQDVQVQKWLGCGYIPERLREDFNIFIKQELRNDNSPLTFTELMTYNTWYELHPEKVAGTMVGSSSFYFPVLIKGTKKDVENMFKAALSNNKTKTFRELVENNESKPKYKVGDKFALRAPLKTNKKSILYIEVVGVKKYEDLHPNVQLWQKAHRNECFYLMSFSKDLTLVYSESRLDKYFELVGTSETSDDELELLELEAEALALELEISKK